MTPEQAKAHIVNFLEIYDPLGMIELGGAQALYSPIADEVLRLILQTPDSPTLAQEVHRLLYLNYGTAAGSVINYKDLGQDLWSLRKRLNPA